ncbi:MAG: ATP-binding protein [Planctomycetes bacterium]|nr:ATP-binding protein [Planctomycetota bacterium]
MPKAPKKGKRKGAGGRRIRLRPADSFDLIRLLARSQSDPRKAIAELVQNSLEAEARHIVITRFRHRGEVALSIRDDGRGVFPDLGREEALERIATNVGRSFKRDLSPEERRQLMIQGKYGIGILGFWSIGARFEMRSRVVGGDVWVLVLQEDDPHAEVTILPQRRLPAVDETFTEILITGLHPAASRQLSIRRIREYLGAELRGQLLEREVEVRLIDRIARGLALKDMTVQPRRFRGVRMEGIDALPVPGFSTARIELYLLPQEDPLEARVSLAAMGTVVCEDIGRLDGMGLDHPPWAGGAIEGLVDFPDLEVAPASRRGFVPTPAALALADALRALEPEILERIREEESRRQEDRPEDIARELRRIFRPLPAQLPQYRLFDVGAGGERVPELKEPAGPGETVPEPPPDESAPPVPEGGVDDEPEDGGLEQGELIPPGPLARVRLTPRRSRLLPQTRRTLRARAEDEGGRPIREGVAYDWSIREGGGTLDADGAAGHYTAPEIPGLVAIAVVAREGDRACEAEATVRVVDRFDIGDGAREGIPTPEPVADPRGAWRSRVEGDRWQFNTAHSDYVAVQADRRRRMRYLVHLFAKEVVLRNHGRPADGPILERMVEVLTHIADRR